MAITASSHILLNGNFHTQTSTICNIYNRALTLGDCISERIHTCADRLCFIDEHLEHLREGMKMAMMKIPEKFFNANRVFSTEISKLITKNRIFHGSLTTILVFRSSFNPESSAPDNIEYIVFCKPSDTLGYKLNYTGLKLAIYEDFPFGLSPMSSYTTHDNALLKVTLHKRCFHDHVDDAIITNSKGYIVETANNGNIFFLKENTLYTPPLADGCSNDIMRRKILEVIAPKMGLRTVSDRPLSEKDFQKSQEMFVADTEHGIQWVAAYKSMRFLRATTTHILDELNNLYQSQQ